jgi:hypothetical protein
MAQSGGGEARGQELGEEAPGGGGGLRGEVAGRNAAQLREQLADKGT